jgi:hypothetical protein
MTPSEFSEGMIKNLSTEIGHSHEVPFTRGNKEIVYGFTKKPITTKTVSSPYRLTDINGGRLPEYEALTITKKKVLENMSPDSIPSIKTPNIADDPSLHPYMRPKPSKGVLNILGIAEASFDVASFLVQFANAKG